MLFHIVIEAQKTLLTGMSWPELARNYYQARIIIIKVGWPAYLLDITHLLRTSEAVFTLKKEHIRIHALCLHIYILRH